jgi:hypothetical protein
VPKKPILLPVSVLFFWWLYTALDNLSKVNAEIREEREIVRRSRAANESDLARATRSVASGDWWSIDNDYDLDRYEKELLAGRGCEA